MLVPSPRDSLTQVAMHTSPDPQSKHTDEKSVGEVRIERYSEDEVSAVKPRFRGKILNFGLAFVAGTGFTLFGFVSPFNISFIFLTSMFILCKGMIRVSCPHSLLRSSLRMSFPKS